MCYAMDDEINYWHLYVTLNQDFLPELAEQASVARLTYNTRPSWMNLLMLNQGTPSESHYNIITELCHYYRLIGECQPVSPKHFLLSLWSPQHYLCLLFLNRQIAYGLNWQAFVSLENTDLPWTLVAPGFWDTWDVCVSIHCFSHNEFKWDLLLGWQLYSSNEG